MRHLPIQRFVVIDLLRCVLGNGQTDRCLWTLPGPNERKLSQRILPGHKEGKKMFYLTTHSTHFNWVYGVGHMINNHSNRERGKERKGNV